MLGGRFARIVLILAVGMVCFWKRPGLAEAVLLSKERSRPDLSESPSRSKLGARQMPSLAPNATPSSDLSSQRQPASGRNTEGTTGNYPSKFISTGSQTPTGERTVTTQQYQKVVQYLKILAKHVKEIEQKLKRMPEKKTGDTKGVEEILDLANLDPAVMQSVSASAGAPTRPGSHGTGFPDLPLLKTYFDFNIISRPGYADFTYDNYHAFLLFEIAPTPDIQFSFEVNPNPKFYELDYQLTSWIQLRVGKIWIPYDDLSPHNIYGGRINVSRLAPGAAFLPDLWTDLGFGIKVNLIKLEALSLDAHAYTVNGFRSGGADPRNPASSGEGYPSFTDLPTLADNNKNKAVGVRFHVDFRIPSGPAFGFGTSLYQGRWTSEQVEKKSLSMLGIDAQARLSLSEIRMGAINMKSDLPGGDQFTSAGMYAELGQKFDHRSRWKFLVRVGKIQQDDRVIDVTDQTIFGLSALYTPGAVQLSIEHSRDVQKINRKIGYLYTAARVVMAF